MFVTFSTDAYTDIMMFKEDALALLKMMGHSETVPGAILAADVPAALEKLKAESQKETVSSQINSSDEDSNNDKQPISANHRAWPLINLLTAAAQKQRDVMWK